ncbi:MAG: MlaD family protein [Saprospiraceae bacterium]
MKISYEARIGILATITLVVLVIGYKFLKGSNLFDDNKMYFVVFDNVQLLDPSAPVFTRGIKVGTVLKVQLDKDNPEKVVVVLDVKGNILLPKNTKAVLISTGLLGGKAIDLRFDHHCNDDCIPNKGTIDSQVESILSTMIPKSEIEDYMGSIGSSLKNTLDSSGRKGQFNILANDLSATMHNLNKISEQFYILLNNNNKQISSSLAGLNTLSQSLASNSKSIEHSIKNLESISSQIRDADIGKLTHNSNETILALQKTAQEANKSMQEINKLISEIQNGSGTASKLIKDPKLYDNLESTSKSLDKLLNDLRLNPGRYVHFSVFQGKQAPATVK